MTTQVVVAVISTVALVVGSVLTWRSARRTADDTRIQRLERRVDRLERRNAVLWRYARDLVDHIYREEGPPPPPWPEELLEEPA